MRRQTATPFSHNPLVDRYEAFMAATTKGLLLFGGAKGYDQGATMLQTEDNRLKVNDKKGHMARTYEGTHPWLKFQLDLVRFPFGLWLQLGEVRSKCQHLAGVPLRPDTARKLHQIYLAKGVLATTAIEGNTLSLEDVNRYLDGKLHLPPSKEYLKTEIENIVQACNAIVETSMAGRQLLTPDVINSFNRMVLNRLELDPEVVPGEIRKHTVGVARYRGAPWEDCQFLVERLLRWLEELREGMPEDLGISGAFIRAILAHLYIAWIHPFGDGNGRTARLIEFTILVTAGVPTPAAHLLSDHYNETRTQYYRELDRASRSGGDVIPFICYAVQGLLDGLRRQIDEITVQQLDVAWRNYVYGVVPHHSETAQRRRRLVFALTQAGRPVKIAEAMTLTTKLAQDYATKTKRTLARDLNALREDALVVNVRPGMIKANLELMMAFMAPCAPPVREHAGARHRKARREGDAGVGRREP